MHEVICKFDMDSELTPDMVEKVAMAIGTARWKLSYYQWIEKIGVPDDAYWSEKWHEFDDLVRAMSKFDSNTLYRMIRDS